MVYNFESSTRTQELIQLPCLNDPRIGGRASPRSGEGFHQVVLELDFF
jgi:hypothetical protein